MNQTLNQTTAEAPLSLEAITIPPMRKAIEGEVYIIKCSIMGQRNWSGKEFSAQPAKIYGYFDDAYTALRCYWFTEYNRSLDDRQVTIIPLSEAKKNKLLAQNQIRW